MQNARRVMKGDTFWHRVGATSKRVCSNIGAQHPISIHITLSNRLPWIMQMTPSTTRREISKSLLFKAKAAHPSPVAPPGLACTPCSTTDSFRHYSLRTSVVTPSRAPAYSYYCDILFCFCPQPAATSLFSVPLLAGFCHQ